MAIKVVTEYLQGTTVRIIAYIKDDDDALVDPASTPTIDIWDSAGAQQVTAAAMTPTATGVYEYYMNTSSSSAEGNWRGVVWAVDGAYTSNGSFGFRVKA